jgi:hypothetical protein
LEQRARLFRAGQAKSRLVTTLVHFQGGWEEEALGLRRGLGEAGGPWEAVALKLDPEGLLSNLEGNPCAPKTCGEQPEAAHGLLAVYSVSS